MFAAREAWKAGLWAPRHWAGNIVAGVIVGVVALPLAMAFAIASGVKPEQGLYTAIVAGVVVSLFGGSRVQIAGPTGAFIVILSGIVAEHGVAGLQLATLMAGLILCAFGLARLGGVIRYIPLPVILGFTAGIGIIIWVGQWQAFFGLPAVPGHFFHEKLWFLLRNLSKLDPVTTAFGFGSLALVLLPRRVALLQRVPGPLLALVAATVLQGIAQFPQLATIGSTFGELPRGLPMPHWPEAGLDRIVPLIGPAFTIALLGAIESLLSAVVADGMTGRRHRSNCELVAQGFANIGSAFFGGVPVTGTIARTATNVRAGARGPVSGMIHSLVLLGFMLVAAPLAAYIPLAALAGVLAVVAWNMADRHQFVSLLKASRGDALVVLATFLLTIFRDLTEGIIVGFLLGAVLFISRMAQATGVEAHAPVNPDDQGDSEGGERERYDPSTATDPDIAVYRITGAFFFGAASAIGTALDAIADQRKAFVLDFSAVPFLDSTAANTVRSTAERARRNGGSLTITGTTAAVKKVLRSHGVDTDLVAYRPSIDEAVADIRAGKSA